MRPIEGVKLTLISDVSHTAYSGMLPGMIAGRYSYEDSHIDLRKLAAFCGARFVKARGIGVDIEEKRVILQDRPPLSFDVVSINIGSTPDPGDGDGVAEFAVPVKPVPEFLKRWQQIAFDLEQWPSKAAQLVIVGGGAGGVELALAMDHRLKAKVAITIIHNDSQILPASNALGRRLAIAELKRRNINIILNQKVRAVAKSSVSLEDSREIPATATFWVTNARPPAWLRKTPLALDGSGFISVKNTLQSQSHDFVFAGGDIATVKGRPSAKSGVFAVRHGKALGDNLRRFVTGKEPLCKDFGSHYFTMIGTGEGVAIATKSFFAHRSRTVFTIKDYIDRRFMKKFSELPVMAEVEGTQPNTGDSQEAHELQALKLKSKMRCSGQSRLKGSRFC
jgi:selenide, water dikinase